MAAACAVSTPHVALAGSLRRQEMQHSSERMREDMASLNQQTDFLQTQVTDRSDQLRMESEQLAQDLHTQLEKRKVQLQKMVQDVVNIGESLQGLVNDFGHLRKESGTNQSKSDSQRLVAMYFVPLGCMQRGWSCIAV
ncbi:Uncharacterized protein SCF082_LOCUS24698 [Durusdinium trenchii]|uniref:t-SNARE coiled-coil homology domain-containing protein n=1 Tax=Durusdinium trenchii TaxID=1381693 RepID=A0ABP0LW17_9DINO